MRRRRAQQDPATPQHERADLPALADREGVLEELVRVICEAWASFDAPRTAEPQLGEELAARLVAPLPEEPGGVEEALSDAARVLDASVSLDGRRRMRPDALSHDAASGAVPVAVVATAGTTLTGAVDPLDEVADVCERHGVWLHVDGAYGLPAAAVPQTAPLFAGLERADSATVDAHKWLGVQKSCSAVLLRETGRLRAAFGHEERYMLHEGDVPNPVDRTLEYSRPLRSLRLWMAFRVHGAAQYRIWIRRTLENARLLAALLREAPDFELLHEPTLSTVCFRYLPPGAEDPDEHNLRLAREMQRDGRVFLAPASVDGRACLRACFVNFRTTLREVERVISVARELGAGWPAPDPLP